MRSFSIFNLKELMELMVANNNDENGDKDKKLKRQQLVHELDSIVANECMLCGEIAVRSIDKPFVDCNGSISWL